MMASRVFCFFYGYKTYLVFRYVDQTDLFVFSSPQKGIVSVMITKEGRVRFLFCFVIFIVPLFGSAAQAVRPHGCATVAGIMPCVLIRIAINQVQLNTGLSHSNCDYRTSHRIATMEHHTNSKLNISSVARTKSNGIITAFQRSSTPLLFNHRFQR